ncbi:MAG: carbamoyltransferase HypF [Minicystis sp.]
MRPAIPADLATCAECLREIAAPGERRRGYPFTNCTRCGPRYTIALDLPYDRARTSMRGFAMCARCAAEYGDPTDRRFHAQPIACPACGPRVRLVTTGGELLAQGDDAIRAAVAAVLEGEIVAVKGLGGFHLLADATSESAVIRLRRRKRRDEKPFAVMFGSIDEARLACVISRAEEGALRAKEAPILLLRRLPAGAARIAITAAVAPDNPRLGALLPYTPLHRMILDLAGRPLVCTSGNLSGEPMCREEDEARARLGQVADRLLTHDRPIVRPVDDSVARVGLDGLALLRRARGFTPLPLSLPIAAPPILALGGHLKSTAAILIDGRAVVSQHLGDLHTVESAALLERTALDLARFLGVRPVHVVCDLHPDYASTRLAERLAATWGASIMRVQHHHAHVAACLAEHGVHGPALGLAWDGAGYGLDGTIWGGEALAVDRGDFERIAHLHPFPLPGGERAFREPRRAALGLLFATCPRDEVIACARAWFREAEIAALLGMLDRAVNTPRTTSVGRLFDAVAALAGGRALTTFEGQAAMDLEHAAEAARASGDTHAYTLPVRAGSPGVIAIEPLVRAILDDRARGVPPGVIAARFHEALAALAEQLATMSGAQRVALGGGCFQSAILGASIRRRLAARGIEVHAPRLYPPNDGGLSLGQLYVAAHRVSRASSPAEERRVPRDPR